MKKKSIIVGGGLGGIPTAIRLVFEGKYDVTIVEKPVDVP